MADQIFSIVWINAPLSGLFAGCVAIMVTLAIERLGSEVGGILAAIPTTIVPASIGFWLTSAAKSTDIDAEGSTVLFGQQQWRISERHTHMLLQLSVVPLGMLINSLFLLVWKFLPRVLPASWKLWQRLLCLSAVSLSFWSIMAVSLACFNLFVLRPLLQATGTLVFGILAYVLTMSLGLIACWKPAVPAAAAPGSAPASTTPKHVPLPMLILRGLLTGSVICISVLLSRTNPIVSGIVSVFPAIFFSAMLFTTISSGDVPKNAIGPIMLSSSSVSLYALVASWTIPLVNLIAGIIYAYGASLAFGVLPAHVYVQWRVGIAKRNSNSNSTITVQQQPVESEMTE